MPSHIYMLHVLAISLDVALKLEVASAFVHRLRANAAARAFLRRRTHDTAIEEWMNNDKHFRGTARDVGVKVRVVRVCFVGAKGASAATMVPAVLRLGLLGFDLLGRRRASAIIILLWCWPS